MRAEKVRSTIGGFREAAGFTLIELMIVLVLISVVLGLSAFYFAGTMQSYKLYAAVRELSSTMSYARSLAQIDGNNHDLVFDLDRKIYGIEGRRQRSIDPRISVSVLDTFNGPINRGNYTFVFRPEGGAEGGIVVLSSGKKIMRIELDPVMGAVVIK